MKPLLKFIISCICFSFYILHFSFCIASNIPRPEYPRPDFERSTPWLNLNGRWQFDFDLENEGEREQWHAPEKHKFALEIIVPFPWQSLKAWGEEARANDRLFWSKYAYANPDWTPRAFQAGEPYAAIGWYKREFIIPPEFPRNKRVILKFGAVNWQAKIWINGKFVGEHIGGYQPFEFDVTDFIYQNKINSLVVKAEDPLDNRALPQGKLGGNWYTRASGIWQTVWLESRDKNYSSRIHILPEINFTEPVQARVNFKITVNAEPEKYKLILTIKNPRGELLPPQIQEFQATESPQVLSIDYSLAAVFLWEPATPHLYSVTCQLQQAGKILDVVNTYFGLRKVETRILPGTDYKYVWLNNHPIYILGALDQAFNPEGIYTYPTEEYLINDIKKAKEFGFNLLRIHLKMDEPLLYYWADKLGILIWQDVPSIVDLSGTYCSKDWQELMEAIIARDYNHPSIIILSCFNESWGIGMAAYKNKAEMQDWVKQQYKLAKDSVPGWLVVDNSPCFGDHLKTDINDWHLYTSDYKKWKQHLNKVCADSFIGSGANFIPGFTQTGEPLLNSEFGPFSGGNYAQRDLAIPFKMLVNEFRLHSKICGYIYTELQDIEWEWNGWMTYSREVKPCRYFTPLAARYLTGQGGTGSWNMFNREDFVAIDSPPEIEVEVGEELFFAVYVSRFGQEKIPEAILKWCLFSVDGQGNIRKSGVSGQENINCSFYKVEKVKTISFPMPDIKNNTGYFFVSLDSPEGESIARNYIIFRPD